MPPELPPSVPVRPRKKPAPTKAAAKPNGFSVAEAIPDPLRDLTHSIEDLHAAAKALNLPPIRLEWAEAEPDLDEDPESKAKRAYVETLLGDYEGLRIGPIATSIAELPTPANPDAFLVGNLIRPGTTVMLAGPPGAAKSWASRQLALAAGCGVELFLERYELERPLNVLVIDEDNGPEEEWRRDERLLAHLGLKREDAVNVRRVSLEGVQLDQERWQRWLRGQIRLHELDLVILDPISEFHGGKELREDPSFRSMVGFLKRLKVDFPRLATILVHHTRKLPASERQSHRGLEDVRGQWGQTPDVIVMLSPLGDRRAKWEVHKRVPHSALILGQVPEGELGEGGLKLIDDEAVIRSRAAMNDDVVIDAIRNGFETFTDIQDGLSAAGHRMAKSTLSGVLNRLIKAGVVSKQGRTFTAPEEE